jgi:RNA polymerase sigma factor (sigma-70 family)
MEFQGSEVMNTLHWQPDHDRRDDADLVLLSGDDLISDIKKEVPCSTERELVEQARFGNKEAFEVLVRKHRATALGVANQMVRDVHLAEDVVQDALIRAFMHLGMLMDSAKFAQWLQRIVRNQALLKIRRGGPYAKEQPFSTITSAGRSHLTNPLTSSEVGETEWEDIDRILFRLQSSVSEESQHYDDPAECLMRREMLVGLRTLLHVLNKRERSIFEAHFFGELSSGEIARLLGTSSASVYNSLSRARLKVRQERTRVTLSLYVKRRAELSLPRRKVLATPF